MNWILGFILFFSAFNILPIYAATNSNATIETVLGRGDGEKSASTKKEKKNPIKKIKKDKKNPEKRAKTMAAVAIVLGLLYALFALAFLGSIFAIASLFLGATILCMSIMALIIMKKGETKTGIILAKIAFWVAIAFITILLLYGIF